LLFLSCRPFVVNNTFSTGLLGVEVTGPSQGTEVTSTPTRPVENVLNNERLTGQKQQLLDGTTVENKGKTMN
jgi:hypothetical protein